jgi:AraC family transcriptional regulator, ethanolamine operon transcriptional activator
MTWRREAVQRAEAYQRTHMGTRVPISSLCRIARCSERSLRNAFHSVRGMSPSRCMLEARLRGVRKALRESWVRPTTVTEAATACGFYELGRFAATYRDMFGEAPSETLRHCSRKPTSEQSTENGQCVHELSR